MEYRSAVLLADDGAYLFKTFNELPAVIRGQFTPSMLMRTLDSLLYVHAVGSAEAKARFRFGRHSDQRYNPFYQCDPPCWLLFSMGMMTVPGDDDWSATDERAKVQSRERIRIVRSIERHDFGRNEDAIRGLVVALRLMDGTGRGLEAAQGYLHGLDGR